MIVLFEQPRIISPGPQYVAFEGLTTNLPLEGDQWLIIRSLYTNTVIEAGRCPPGTQNALINATDLAGKTVSAIAYGLGNTGTLFYANGVTIDPSVPLRLTAAVGPAPEFTPTRVAGKVQIDGTPAQRTVRAFGYNATAHAIDGETVSQSKSLGHTTSDPATGEYTIDLLAGYGQEIFVVAFDDYGDAFTAEQALAVGDRIHPTTPNGHVWETTGAGTLPTEEPAWVVDTETAQLYGTASMIARPFYRPMVHGPISPEVTSAPVAGWSPADLFQNSEVGIWLDPSDLTTMFIDEQGSIPVTADGDPVGLLLDKSGNGNHAFAELDHRPIYRTDGTLHWLEFDRVSGQYLKAPQVIYGLQDRCIFYVTEPFSLGYASSPRPAFDLTEAPSAGTGSDFTPTHESDGVYLRVSGNSFWPVSLVTNAIYRFVIEWDYTNGARTSDDAVLTIDGAVEPIGSGAVATLNTAQTTNMLIGHSNRQNDGYFDGKMFELVALRGVTTAQQKQDMEKYLIEKLAS
jgi:hypothetical protein